MGAQTHTSEVAMHSLWRATLRGKGVTYALHPRRFSVSTNVAILQEAKSFVPESSDGQALLAIHLTKLQAEKEFDKEKRQAEFRHRCEVAKLKCVFARVTQRTVFERFMATVWDELIKLPDNEWQEMTAETMQTNVLNRCKSKPEAPRISSIERACRTAVGSRIVHRLIGTKFPMRGLPEQLLYGSLSDEVHNPAVEFVWCSSSDSEELKAFFHKLAGLYDKGFAEIDEGEASLFTAEDSEN